MKKLCMIMLALCAISAANAATYWLGAGANANLAGCFNLYSDEAMTSAISITPSAN